jgi:hypothetical protein
MQWPDLSVAWQCLSKIIVFLLMIKLHAQKARPFQRQQQKILAARNDLACRYIGIVSDVQFGNLLLKNRPLSRVTRLGEFSRIFSF